MADNAGVPTLDEIPGATGFPYTVMPSGWFQVGWSHDLKPGDVRPLRYFKSHQVLFRTEEGDAVLMAAFCAHFGAHLGHGGRVEGCTIVCPYHGWSWDANGRNVYVPAMQGPSPARRRIRTYQIVETNGIIWAWHDALGRDPLWHAPEERRMERNYLDIGAPTTYGWKDVTVQPQFVMENVVDIDHLIYVHRNTMLSPARSKADFPELREDGAVIHANYPAPGTINRCYGIGIVMTEFPTDEERPWRLPSVVYSCTTPVDNNKSDIFGTVLVEQDPQAEGADNKVPVGKALKRVNEQHSQASADFTIWDNMVYMQKPAYSAFEGKLFLTMRRWARQFYPEQAVEPEVEREPQNASA